jgi:hypothetical protein
MRWAPEAEGLPRGCRQMGSDHQPIAFRPQVLNGGYMAWR